MHDMVDAGRPKLPLALSAAERAALHDLATARSTPDPLRLRSRIVLACADGQSNKDVATALMVTPATVGKWRRRFVRMGMAGLDDGARSGRPRMVDRATLTSAVSSARASSMADTGQAAGSGRQQSTRALARAHGISQSTAARIQREVIDRRRLRPVAASGVLPARTAPQRAPELLSDRVYEAIRGWIVSGELAPGMRVVESEIARILGTSQAPAREAVRRLAHEGLVTHRPRLGNFVTEISQVEAREAREVRVLLETQAARRATGRLHPGEVALFRAEVQQMCDAAERKDIGAFREADLRFHRLVCVVSGNSMLLKVWRTLEPALWNLQVVSNAMYAGDWKLMARRHADLVDALESGDPEDAARLFSAHARGECSTTRPTRRHA
jgi:DNA-binding GntR family transcriptional regulator/DNA-binding CsgD family transcriptional regulator